MISERQKEISIMFWKPYSFATGKTSEVCLYVFLLMLYLGKVNVFGVWYIACNVLQYFSLGEANYKRADELENNSEDVVRHPSINYLGNAFYYTKVSMFLLSLGSLI